MADLSRLDEETKNYFNTLPIFIKETILQSGYVINDKEDLQNVLESLTETNN